ncbi:MAG: ATP synthase F0 subunit B [Pseudomonadota bacterium]
MLSLNFTLIIQVVVFLSLLWLLNRFLFKPVENILDERLAKTQGLTAKAEEIERELVEKAKEYEIKLKEARTEGLKARDGLKREGLDEEKAVVSRVTKEAKNSVEEKKGGIYSDAEAVRKELEPQMREISRDISVKLLGRRIE